MNVYVAGVCIPNPGPVAWAAIIVDGDTEQVVTGTEPEGTTPRAELLAAIGALEAIPTPARVSLHSASGNVVSAFSEGWLTKWRANHWRTKEGAPIANRDLWERLAEAAARHDVEWVRSRDPQIARAHALAREGINDMAGILAPA